MTLQSRSPVSLGCGVRCSCRPSQRSSPAMSAPGWVVSRILYLRFHSFPVRCFLWRAGSAFSLCGALGRGTYPLGEWRIGARPVDKVAGSPACRSLPGLAESGLGPSNMHAEGRDLVGQ